MLLDDESWPTEWELREEQFGTSDHFECSLMNLNDLYALSDKKEEPKTLLIWLNFLN